MPRESYYQHLQELQDELLVLVLEISRRAAAYR